MSIVLSCALWRSAKTAVLHTLFNSFTSFSARFSPQLYLQSSLRVRLYPLQPIYRPLLASFRFICRIHRRSDLHSHVTPYFYSHKYVNNFTAIFSDVLRSYTNFLSLLSCSDPICGSVKYDSLF